MKLIFFTFSHPISIFNLKVVFIIVVVAEVVVLDDYQHQGADKERSQNPFSHPE